MYCVLRVWLGFLVLLLTIAFISDQLLPPEVIKPELPSDQMLCSGGPFSPTKVSLCVYFFIFVHVNRHRPDVVVFFTTCTCTIAASPCFNSTERLQVWKDLPEVYQDGISVDGWRYWEEVRQLHSYEFLAVKKHANGKRESERRGRQRWRDAWVVAWNMKMSGRVEKEVICGFWATL